MVLVTVVCWVCLVYGAFKVAEFLWRSTARFAAGMLPRNMLKEYGENSWAVITGASDGIGAEFAKYLARRGFNICLVSRTKSKLERIATDISKLYPKSQTKIVVVDLSYSASEPYMFDKIFDEIKMLDVSLLVNSAGLYDVGFFENISEEAHLNEVNVNVIAPVRITRKFVPLLLDHTNKTTKRCGIINISSVAGLIVCPTSAVYSATKAALYMFSRCLQAEYKGKIDILSLHPMLVTSAMTRNRKTFLSVSAESCARSALPKLGRVDMTLGHWFHELQYTILDALPSFIADRIQRKNLYDLLAEYTAIDAANQQKKSQ